MNETQKEVKRKLETSIEIIQEAHKLVDEIEDANPEIVNHLIDVIDKQSQLLDIYIKQTKAGQTSGTPDIDDGLSSLLDEYYQLKKEEIRAKLARMEGKIAQRVKKKIGFEE